jgi:excisionase family DNA binding protein
VQGILVCSWQMATHRAEPDSTKASVGVTGGKAASARERPTDGTLTPEQVHRIRSDPPVVLSAVEGSVYTTTSERKFRDLAAQGVFPSIRLGRRILFRRDALDAALARLESVMKQETSRNSRPRRRGQPSAGNTKKKEIQ